MVVAGLSWIFFRGTAIEVHEATSASLFSQANFRISGSRAAISKNVGFCVFSASSNLVVDYLTEPYLALLLHQSSIRHWLESC